MIDETKRLVAPRGKNLLVVHRSARASDTHDHVPEPQ